MKEMFSEIQVLIDLNADIKMEYTKLLYGIDIEAYLEN